MSLTQNFIPNNKTIDYISFLLTSKLGNDGVVKTLNDAADKVRGANVLKNAFTNELTIDRNLILQLQILRNLILHFQEQKKNNMEHTVQTIQVIKEILPMLDIIETNYHKLKDGQCDVFMTRPSELFHLILNSNTKSIKIFDKYVELAIEYIEQLEFMSYSLINYIDEIDFDIHSYSTDFFNIFLSIPLYTPEN
jgi:hypothetical protein